MKKPSAKTGFLNFFRNALKNNVAESLLIHFTNGKQWSHFAARIPANYYQYKKGSVRRVVRNGFQLELDISDYMQWLLYFGVQTEPREALYSMIKPGMIIFDIGANIGETAMMFSRMTGPSGHVYAFEPDPSTFRHLQKHLEWNQCTNVTAVPMALSDKEGQMFIENNPHNTAGNRLSETTGVATTVSTLNHYVASGTFQKIDLLKIDVEGFEMKVLSGAGDTLNKYKPRLFVEAVDAFLQLQQSSTKELVKQLQSHHYRLINAYDQSVVQPEMNFADTHFDIIAEPV